MKRRGFKRSCPPLRAVGVSQLSSTELTHCKRVNYSQRQRAAAFTEFASHGTVFRISWRDCSPSRKTNKNKSSPFARGNKLAVEFCVSKLFNLCCCQYEWRSRSPEVRPIRGNSALSDSARSEACWDCMTMRSVRFWRRKKYDVSQGK